MPADCPADYTCVGGFCYKGPKCSETTDCPIGEGCVNGECVKEQEGNQTDDGFVPTKKDGESCASNNECYSNSCSSGICTTSVTPATNAIFDRTIIIGGRQVHITIMDDAIYINGRRYERSTEGINEVEVTGLPEGEPLGGLGIIFRTNNIALYLNSTTAIVLNQSLFDYSPCVSDGMECIASGECCSDNCDNKVCKAPTCNVNSDCAVNRSCALPLCAMHSCTYLMNGCDFFGSCRANGERETVNGTPSYCSSDRWHPQLKNGEACQHDSECLDYLCDSGKCGQSGPFGIFFGIIDEILNAIKGLFGMR